MMPISEPLVLVGDVLDPRFAVIQHWPNKPPTIIRINQCPLNVYTTEQCLVIIGSLAYLTTDPAVYFCNFATRWSLVNRMTVELLRADASVHKVQFDSTLFPLAYDEGSSIYALENVDMALSLGYIPVPHSRIFWAKKGTKIPSEIEEKYSYLEGDLTSHKIRNNNTAAIVASQIGKLQIPELDSTLVPMLHLLDGYTYGLEFETSYTEMPDAYCAYSGLVKLKDGSLPSGGCEYTTVPLSGAVGIHLLNRGIDLMTPHCNISMECSLHVHLSGFTVSKEFIVALYYLYFRVQYEILDFLPHYLRNTVAIGRKQKLFADTLPNLGFFSKSGTPNVDELFNNISAHYRGTSAATEVIPAWADRSWYHPGRYHAVNMSNLYAGGETIEFRVHPPSLDKTKIFNWLALVTTITKVAESNTEYIISCITNRDKLCLADVITAIRYNDYSLTNPIYTDNAGLTSLSESLLTYVASELILRGQQESEAREKSYNRGQDGKFEIYRALAIEEFARQGQQTRNEKKNRRTSRGIPGSIWMTSNRIE